MKNRRAAREWLRKAADDLTLAKRSIQGKKKIAWAACFHTQQSAEKDFKAFLVWENVVPEKTHDLLELLKQCTSRDPSFAFLERLSDLLNPYSVQVRYPEELRVTLADARKAIKAAEGIKEFVVSKIG